MDTCRLGVLTASFLALACVAGSAGAGPAGRCEAVANAADSVGDQQALHSATTRAGDLKSGLGLDPRQRDRHALEEMLLGDGATPLRWDRVPELVVLMPVMQYEKGRGTEYRATLQQLTDQEAAALVSDLTDALSVLTDRAFRGFSAIRRETDAAGEMVNVMRPGQIVVARYNGVRDQTATLGFGGRSTRGSTIRAASIILDSDFDRQDSTRRLLRMHELGHALGYNHVKSRISIMNPKIGPGPTDVDRAAARIAFEGFRAAAESCS